jgi:hypothetical protein
MLSTSRKGWLDLRLRHGEKRYIRCVPSLTEVHDMPISGTLNEIAATARSEVDRARIHSYEYLSVYAGAYLATLLLNRHAIIGEAASNVLLPADDALSPEREDRLESLGWTRPDDMFHPFFHRTWSTEAASETIVRDLLTALICVAGLEEGEQVACSGGTWCGAPGSGYACDGRSDWGKLPVVPETGVLRQRRLESTSTRLVHVTCKLGV